MSGHVSVPNPLTLVISHFVGTWPQFSRHDISGIGTPTALHVVTNTEPTSSVINGGGGVWNWTGTIERRIKNVFKKYEEKFMCIYIYLYVLYIYYFTYGNQFRHFRLNNHFVNHIGMILERTLCFYIRIR